MPTMEQIRRITIQSRTEGVNESAAALEKLKGSYGGVAGVSGTTEAKTKSVSLAFDRLQRTLDETYRAEQAFTKQHETLNRAFQQGLVTQQRYDELSGMASKRLNDNARANEGLAKSTKASSFQTANLAAQFNDIAVSLQGGQSPFTVALQQGTQISQVLGQRGATGVVSLLGSAFTSLLSPVALATIGVIGLGGAAIQYGAKAIGAVNDLDERIKTHIELVNSLKSAYRDAGKGVDTTVRESQDVIRALLSISTDKLQKDFQRLAQSAAAPGQQMAQFVDDFGRIIEVGADKFAPFRKAIDDFNASVRAGKPDVSGFRSAIADVVSSSADQKVRTIGGELLDASKNAGELANSLRAVGDAGKELDATAVAAAAMNKSFADAIKTLSSTVSKNLTDRQKIEKNFAEVMKSANTDDKQMAAMLERDNQLAILSFNDRKKAAEEAAKASEAAVKRFNSLIDQQSKKNAGIDGQIAAIGQGVGELAKLEAQYRLTEAAQQAFGTVSDKTAAKIKTVADQVGAAALMLGKLRLDDQIKFDRSQIGLSDSERSANSQLRPLFGNDTTSAQAQFYKMQVQVNDSLPEVADNDNKNPEPKQQKEKAA